MAKSADSEHYFLRNGGEMGHYIREMDWNSTPIGNPASWPQCLKAMVAMMLVNPIGMCIAWGEEFITIYNDSWPPILGDIALGKPAVESFPAITSILKEAKQGNPQQLNGYLNYFDLTATPLITDDGTIGGVLVTVVETTGKQFEVIQELEQSDLNLRNIVMRSPVGVCILDAHTLVSEIVNDSFLEIVGRPLEQISGKYFWDSFPEVKAYYELILKQVVEDGVSYYASEVELKLVRNGQEETIYVTFVFAPLKNPDSRVNKIAIWVLENTTQVAARRLLEEAEERGRLAIHSAELGIYEVVYEGDILTTDQRFRDIWGVKNENAIREEIRSTIHPDDNPIRVKAHLASLQTGHLSYQARVIHPDESVHWVNITGRVLFDGGKPRKLIGVIQDITDHIEEKNKIEEQVAIRTQELADVNNSLERSNAELAQFAYIASHDLQEPLRKITMFSNMLEKNLEQTINEQGRKYLEKIHNSATRMHRLINDVLAYSRLRKDHEIFEMVDLNEIIKNAIEDYELLIEQKNATILYENLPTVEAIPLQMAQLFGNLIGNALKFTRTDVIPVIGISANRATEEEYEQLSFPRDLEYYKIQLRDNGIGLRPEHSEQIFEIFKRLHKKSDYEGTGIGLAMCKKIAMNHRGDINALGSNQEGAVFNIYLPLIL